MFVGGDGKGERGGDGGKRGRDDGQGRGESNVFFFLRPLGVATVIIVIIPSTIVRCLCVFPAHRPSPAVGLLRIQK